MRDPFGSRENVHAQQYREQHTDPNNRHNVDLSLLQDHIGKRNHKRDSGFKRNNPPFNFSRALASSAHIG
jgi:hypothetical protein